MKNHNTLISITYQKIINIENFWLDKKEFISEIFFFTNVLNFIIFQNKIDVIKLLKYY